MLKKHLLVATIITLSIASKSLYADTVLDPEKSGYSYKTGCKYNSVSNDKCIGSIGYIHITPWQESEKKNKNLTCKLNIFIKKRNLPKVGSIVKADRALIFYQDFEQIKRRYEVCDKQGVELHKVVDLKKTPFKTETERKMCGISGCLAIVGNYDADGEVDAILPWRELKIISYETINENLFAKIEVVK